LKHFLSDQVTESALRKPEQQQDCEPFRGKRFYVFLINCIIVF